MKNNNEANTLGKTGIPWDSINVVFGSPNGKPARFVQPF